MAINVTGLTNYVEEHNLPLLRNAVLGSRTTKEFNLFTDVKGATALNILNTQVVFGDGYSCGWDNAGNSTLSQRIITPGYIKVNMDFCDKDLLKTWANYEVRVAAGQKTLPFEEDFITGVVENVNAALEKAIWLGDTSTGNTDPMTNKFDGVIKIAENSSLAATYVYDASTTVITAINDTIALLPYEAKSKGEIVCYVGSDMYDAYIRELMANGNLVINLQTGFDSINRPAQMIIPGTDVKLIPINGLNSTGRIFVSYRDNFIYGTDMVNDQEKFELWYSKDNREFRLAIEFTAATQIAFPDMLVMGKLGE